MAKWADMRATRRHSGLITTEAALIMPLLLILVFGVLEYGWMFLKASEVSNAARRGARAAVVPAVTSDGQVKASVIALLTQAGIPAAAANITVTGVDAAPGNLVTVVVSVPYSDVKLLGFPFLPTPTNLRASVSMAKEGP